MTPNPSSDSLQPLRDTKSTRPLIVLARLVPHLAQGRSLRRRSDSVRFLRSFCRADEATGMPLHDPKRLSSGPPEADNAYQICSFSLRSVTAFDVLRQLLEGLITEFDRAESDLRVALSLRR